MNKVPQATLVFWLIKIMATTVGETAADFLIFHFNLGLSLTSAIAGVLLVLSLFTQIRNPRYSTERYWITVVLVSIFGTLISDNMVDHFDIPLQVTTAIFSVLLAATFAWWYLREKTLSIHSITTRRRELFYWAAILFTFALGTAAGDLVSEEYGLGYLHAGLLFAGLIALVTAAYYALGLNAIVAFWAAYILTRPFGASCGDLMAQAPEDGGLGFGVNITSAVFLVIILALALYLKRTESR